MKASKRTPKTRALLAGLLEGNTLTTWDAVVDARTARLSGYIHAFKARGFQIETTYATNPSGEGGRIAFHRIPPDKLEESRELARALQRPKTSGKRGQTKNLKGASQ